MASLREKPILSFFDMHDLMPFPKTPIPLHVQTEKETKPINF